MLMIAASTLFDVYIYLWNGTAFNKEHLTKAVHCIRIARIHAYEYVW